MFNRSALLSLPLLALASEMAQAHPGHSPIEGWLHAFTPEHVLPALIGVGVILFLIGRRRPRDDE